MPCDDLRQGPVRQAVAVGGAAALSPGAEELGALVHDSEELSQQACLAESGLSFDERVLGRPGGDGLVQESKQHAELDLAANHRRRRTRQGASLGDGPPREPALNGFGLAFGAPGRQSLVDDGPC